MPEVAWPCPHPASSPAFLRVLRGPEPTRPHAGGSDNPSRALTKEPRAVGRLAGTVGGGTGSVAPEDAAPRGAGGRGLGGCLAWSGPRRGGHPSAGRREGQEGGRSRLPLPRVLPSRKRQGLSPRAAGQASSALLGTPSPQARRAGMRPRPEPRLVWPQAPHQAPLTRLSPGQGQLSEGNFLEEAPWDLPDARGRLGARTRWGLSLGEVGGGGRREPGDVALGPRPGLLPPAVPSSMPGSGPSH